MGVVLEGKSVPLDPDAALAALPSLAPLLARLPDYPAPSDAARDLPATTAEWAELAIDEYDDGDGAVNFLQALLVDRMPGWERAAADHDGDLFVATDEAQAAVHHGSLTVRGNLDLDAHLFVLGDLHVHGRVRDLVDWTRLIVTGDLRCATMWSASPVWVAGQIDVQVAYLASHGKIFAGRGLRADLVIESPGVHGVDGEIDAAYHSPASEWSADARAALDRLASVVVPEAMEVADRNWFVPNKLFALVESGQPYRRERKA